MRDTPGDAVRARLVLSYDGSGFAGWASQPALRTVQGELEAALERVVRQPVRVTVAGRTDAGVHARRQVAHADIPRGAWEAMPGRSDRTPAQALRDRLDAVTADDLVIGEVVEAPAGFDARFSATERVYRYRISDSIATRDPLMRTHVAWFARPLDVDALNAASATLLGLRDFAAFCRAREGATTIRDLKEFSWERPASGADAALVVATVRADAFCHSMVRSLVGAVVPVGEGRRDLAWLASVASSRERTSAIAVADARGLTLESVAYPADDELASRADATRARRQADELERAPGEQPLPGAPRTD